MALGSNRKQVSVYLLRVIINTLGIYITGL